MHGHIHLALREIDELYVSVAIRTIALSLVSIFVPIYLLLNHGFDTMIIFFITVSISQILSILPSAILISRYGPKHSIILSIPFTILFYIFLSSGNIWASAIIGGISNALFWMGYHSDIAMNMRKSRDVGTVMAASMIASSISPFIGAILISAFSYGAAFAITSTLFLISGIPLMLTPDRHSPFEFSLSPQIPRYAPSLIAHGFETFLVQILWPVTIYQLFKSNSILGAVTSISLFASSIFILKVPPIKHTKRYKRYVTMNSIAWIAKSIASSLFAIASLDLFHWVVKNAMWYDFNRKVYGNAKKSGILNTIISREIATQAGKTMSLIALLALKSTKISIILSGIGTLLYLLI